MTFQTGHQGGFNPFMPATLLFLPFIKTMVMMMMMTMTMMIRIIENDDDCPSHIPNDTLCLHCPLFFISPKSV